MLLRAATALVSWRSQRLRGASPRADFTGRCTLRQPVIGSRGRKSTRGLRATMVGALLATCGVLSPIARADDADFAKSKNCLNCHAVDTKVVGPAYRSVAARYAGDRDAEAKLAKKIRDGGAGAWGVVPMPANDVTQAEAQRLARWVLTLR